MDEQIKELYLKGLSAREVKEVLSLNVSERQIQRKLARWGIIRKTADAFRLANAKGLVPHPKNPGKIKRIKVSRKIRYQILERDGFRCVLCGADAGNTLLQVDHKDENKNNNVWDNLQTLCQECNLGKMLVARERKN